MFNLLFPPACWNELKSLNFLRPLFSTLMLLIVLSLSFALFINFDWLLFTKWILNPQTLHMEMPTFFSPALWLFVWRLFPHIFLVYSSRFNCIMSLLFCILENCHFNSVQNTLSIVIPLTFKTVVLGIVQLAHLPEGFCSPGDLLFHFHAEAPTSYT